MILFSVFRYFLLICFVISYHKVDSPDYPLLLLHTINFCVYNRV